MNAKRGELEKVQRDLGRLVHAILDGVPGSQVKDKMNELKRRKEVLRKQLDQAEEMPALLHPNLSAYYREQIGRLREALLDESRHEQASQLMRGLIDCIELVPVTRDGRRGLEINLHGRLADILSLAMKKEKPLEEDDLPLEVVKLVAGAGFVQERTNRKLVKTV